VRVVNHWASWCIPCTEEFPELVKLHARFGEKLTFFGISWDMFDPRGDEEDIREHIENYAEGHSIPYPSLLVTGSVKPAEFFKEMNITYDKIPQTWVIGTDGQVLRKVEAVLEGDALKDLEAYLESLT